MPQNNLKTNHVKDLFYFNLKFGDPKNLFGNKAYIRKLTLMGLPPSWIRLNRQKNK
jgi:hypothetical protein